MQSLEKTNRALQWPVYLIISHTGISRFQASGRPKKARPSSSFEREDKNDDKTARSRHVPRVDKVTYTLLGSGGERTVNISASLCYKTAGL